MSYTFLDAFSSVQSADSSVISGSVQRPIVNIASVLTAVPVTLSGASVSGAVQIAGNSPSSIASVQRIDQQIVGSTMGFAGQTVIHGITAPNSGQYLDFRIDTGTQAIVASVVGLQGASVSGTVGAIQSGTWTVSGSVLTLSAPTASLVSGVTSVITGTSSVQVLAAAPGGQRNYVTQMLVTNGAATGTFVNIVDGGNVIYSGYAAASGGGFSASFYTPLKQTNSVLGLYVAAVSSASIIAAMSGYTAT